MGLMVAALKSKCLSFKVMVCGYTIRFVFF